MLVYVDDILLLGIEVVYTDSDAILSQCQYMFEVLRKACVESCKPLATPMSTFVPGVNDDASLLDNPISYMQLVGSLA